VKLPGRILFNLLAGFSALLFVPTVALFVQSYDHFLFAEATNEQVHLSVCTARGRISFYRSYRQRPRKRSFIASAYQLSGRRARYAADSQELFISQGFNFRECHGFGFGRRMRAAGPATALSFPLWSLLVALAALPAASVVKQVARGRRRQINLCAECGYDLRATPHRCPECGVLPQDQSQRPAGQVSFSAHLRQIAINVLTATSVGLCAALVTAWVVTCSWPCTLSSEAQWDDKVNNYSSETAMNIQDGAFEYTSLRKAARKTVSLEPYTSRTARWGERRPLPLPMDHSALGFGYTLVSDRVNFPVEPWDNTLRTHFDFRLPLWCITLLFLIAPAAWVGGKLRYRIRGTRLKYCR